MDDSIDSGNFSVRGYLPLIQKDSTTHMHSLAVYLKEGLPFVRVYFSQCLTSSYSLDHLCRYARFLILFHLTDEVLSINPSAYVFVFGLCHNFSISNDLTQIVNFPTRIPDCDSHSPTLLDLFLSSDKYLFFNGFPSIWKF